MHDSRGGQIRGLSKEAFSLKEKGKNQQITLFEEVRPDNGPTPRVPDRGYGNVAHDGAGRPRLTIIALDLLSMKQQLEQTEAKELLADFLEKGLVEGQPVSLVKITSDGLEQIQPITADREKLLQAVKKMPIWTGMVAWQQNHVVVTIQSLRDIAEAYAGIPGRKSLILVGESLPGTAARSRHYGSGNIHGGFAATGPGSDECEHFRVPERPGRPDSTVGRTRSEGVFLNSFAGDTGGHICFAALWNGCLADAVEDSLSYYMLGFHVLFERPQAWMARSEGQRGC